MFYIPRAEKPKLIAMNISPSSNVKDILTTVNKKFDGYFTPIHEFALVFVHKQYGEKIVDEFDSPLSVL